MTETLSEKIASVLSAAPTTFDPEDDVYEETRARVVSPHVDDAVFSDEDVGQSQFRKQNVSNLEDVDSRYIGKSSSRKRLLDSDFEDEKSLDDFEVSEQGTSSDEQDNESDGIDEETGGESGSDDSVDTENEQSFKHLEKSDVSDQIKKGTCVRNQLSMWESLLEIRIQMQKCLLTANKLPQVDTFNDLKQNCRPEFVTKVTESKNFVADLLDKLLFLQELVVKKYPETKTIFSGVDATNEDEVKSDEEIPSDTDEESDDKTENTEADEVPRKKYKVSDCSDEINKRHKAYRDYRNSVIQKWNDKTRIAASKSGNVVHSVTNQIEHILSDKQKLLKRTQLKRNDYEIVGQKPEELPSQDENLSKEPDVYNSNIFDDTDFYHHLLRELIEFKSADLSDPVQLGRQWLQLQNLRSKMKRKIDTKATKGRKIRYVVHSKLVNFMAPIEENTWQEEAKTELYGSLFGKNQVINGA